MPIVKGLIWIALYVGLSWRDRSVIHKNGNLVIAKVYQKSDKACLNDYKLVYHRFQANKTLEMQFLIFYTLRPFISPFCPPGRPF